MPPKAKFTKEQIVETALDIIRDEGVEAITAQAMAKQLGTSTRPIFTYFDTVEDLRTAATDAAWQIYDERVAQGLALTPAFKGFGMACVRFAVEEPSLFRLLLMRKSEQASINEFLEHAGHLEDVLGAVMNTFHIDRDQAMWLYENMLIYVHGIAAMCASEVVKFTDEEVAERLGVLCRGLLMVLHAPADERTSVIPGTDVVFDGNFEDYF
ncbi:MULTISPECIES: TetR/AcrR family transcriptional regulator [unclassified Adlercreutzia]|uniref:TetR/AcrR family transcriptional regulator n=1 Tax=unclassified Adlercreutzia TaxID=2636013 RepID=UPI0013EA3E61|nr:MULTISPECIES: TetR/AcrR family transcriptional regulator [unclassified Adlercreutzia]